MVENERPEGLDGLDDAEFEAQQARVRAFLDAWLDATGLSHWTVHVAWHRGGAWRNDEDVLFTCVWQWEYVMATIHANLPLIARRSDAEVERAVVHEIAHCWTSELADSRKASDYDQHEEHSTSSIAAALLRVRATARKERSN